MSGELETRTITTMYSQTFTKVDLYCKYCGKFGYWEADTYDDYDSDDTAYCAHCDSEGGRAVFYNADTKAKLKNCSEDSVLDCSVEEKQVTKSKLDWALSDRLTESMSAFRISLQQSLYGDGSGGDEE